MALLESKAQVNYFCLLWVEVFLRLSCLLKQMWFGWETEGCGMGVLSRSPRCGPMRQVIGGAMSSQKPNR
jgi:hypothetical protein